MSDKPVGSEMPGDSKSTADKLADTAQSVGQNIVDTGKHYADKTGAADTADKAQAKVESVGQNVVDTGKHYADKAEGQPGQEKTLLEQAGDMAAQAYETVSKAATDAVNAVSDAVSGEKK